MYLLNEILLVVVGAAALFVLQRIPIICKVFGDVFNRVIHTIDTIRKFVFAKKITRIKARAQRISRDDSVSLYRLERTLFDWYAVRQELLPYVMQIHQNHNVERVRSAAYDLLWYDKPLTALKVGDVVNDPAGHSGHVLHIRYDEDATRVLWDATPSSTSGTAYHSSASVRVTRDGWCPLSECRYCDMSSDQVREIGEWWWGKEQANNEANRLRQGGKCVFVRSVEDADRAFEGLVGDELIAIVCRRALHAPETLDGEPAKSAETVADLKLLASEGWTFQVLRCDDYDRLPRVVMFDWCPPAPGN